MRILAFVVATLCLLAGCLQSAIGVPWASIRCDDDGPGRRSLVGGPLPAAVTLEHVYRLAEAMDDPIADSRTWATMAGSIRPGRGDGTLLIYEAQREWSGETNEQGRAALRQIARELKMPGTFDVRYFAEGGSGVIWQTAAGMEIGFTTSLLTWVDASHNGGPFVRFTWRPFFELPKGPQVTEKEAIVVATDFSRCAMDYYGRTQATGYHPVSGDLLWKTLYADNGTLYYTVHVKFTHPTSPPCPSATTEPLVNVDAWTGAILRLDWNVCGWTS